jgi:hypothetical protein
VVVFDNSVGPSSTAPLVPPPPSSTIPNRKSGIRNRNNHRVFNRFHFSNRKYSPLLRPPRRIAIFSAEGRGFIPSVSISNVIPGPFALCHPRKPLLPQATRHSRLIDNPARIVVLSDQREWKDLSSILVLIAGSAIRNQYNPRDFNNFHFSNRIIYLTQKRHLVILFSCFSTHAQQPA